MTVSSSTSRVQFNGNGSTTVFAYSFKIFDQDDLTVIVRSATGTETVKTITTHYTVSGVGNAGGGNVTMLTAPASGETLTILREQDLVQELDLVENDPFPAQSLEDALDKLTFIVQQHDEELGRSIKASRTNTIGSTEFTVSAADRASKIFAFNSAGELSVAQELGTYRGNWATSTAFAERDIVKDTSNNNIYICVTAHTSTGSQPISSNADVAKWALLVDAASATTSASAAASSASAAATSATNASNSATAAAGSASSASSSASTATTQATNAASSASAAATSATNAAASETAAAGSASSASSSASTATTQASNASTSASAASSSASAASTSATNAATSATNASNSASAASTSATNASNSATAAASSASAASTSATNAAASAAAAAASFDAFDDIYLGSKSSDPSVDNDGNALTTGDQYFNSVANELRVWNGSTWQAASTVGGTVSSLSVTGDVTIADKIIHAGDTNTAIRFPAADTVTVETAGSERLRITSAGDVGIGTTSPTADLSVGSATSSSGDVHLRTSKTTLELTPSNSDAGGMDINVGFVAGGQGPLKFSIGGTERMRIDASGNVGIGTSSPSDKLQIVTPLATTGTGIVSPNGITLQNTNSTAGNYTTIQNRDSSGSQNAQIQFINVTHGSPFQGTIAFTTRASTGDFAERMRIDSSGNLLVGTTSLLAGSDARLQADGGGTYGALIKSGGDATKANTTLWHVATTGNNAFMDFGTQGSFTSRGSITYNRGGGLVAYNTTSDYRAKDIAGAISDASSTVLSLKPYMGTMKGAEIARPMFVAHETQEIAPYAVTGQKDAVDNDGNAVYQQMDHSALVPLLTAALQEALTEIASLKARLDAASL